ISNLLSSNLLSRSSRLLRCSNGRNAWLSASDDSSVPPPTTAGASEQPATKLINEIRVATRDVQIAFRILISPCSVASTGAPREQRMCRRAGGVWLRRDSQSSRSGNSKSCPRRGVRAPAPVIEATPSSGNRQRGDCYPTALSIGYAGVDGPDRPRSASAHG